MQITLEGHDQPVPVRAGDTMVEALLRAGVAFPFSCQAGNCGTCKCELVSGDILELEHSEHARAPEQRAKGIILACRTQVWDDAVIRRIDAEDLVMHPSRVMRCRVLELEALTHDIRGVRLAIEAGGPLTFSAGQYAQLEFAPGLSRHYSMANTPHEPELVFHIRHMPGGRTSRYVAEQLKIGDKVKVSGPFGVAYLRERRAGLPRARSTPTPSTTRSEHGPEQPGCDRHRRRARHRPRDRRRLTRPRRERRYRRCRRVDLG